MPRYGTLNVLEDLATNYGSVLSQETDIADRFNTALSVHNEMFNDMVSSLATITSLPLMPYGGVDAAIIEELDEWGAADASKATAYGNLGLPLRIYGGTVQWTRTYFENVSAAELSAQLDAFALADIQKFQANIRRAFFKNTNTAGYVDRLQSKLTYDLKALLNADGQAIPASPNGATFDGSTHTHYLASATLTAAAVQQLIDTVVEHGVDGVLKLYISKADEATVRAFTGFSPYLDARVTVTGAAQIGSQALDTVNPDNRAIGVFGGAEVWVKPWVPANYQAVVDEGGSVKPLGIRTRTGALTGSGSFRIVADHEHYPIRARNVGREYGVGVVGRHKAAVMRSNNATYAAPAGI